MNRTDRLLSKARGILRRVNAGEAAEAQSQGTVLIDIRPESQRAAHGEIPGALLVERNVLEWRLDPEGEARLPLADNDTRFIVFCQEGYASSLAAASLREIGVKATDLEGGFEAWRAAALPVTTPPGPDPVHP